MRQQTNTKMIMCLASILFGCLYFSRISPSWNERAMNAQSFAVEPQGLATKPEFSKNESSLVETILQSMTLEQKIAQMTQIDVNSVIYPNHRDPKLALNRGLIAYYAKQGIGSYFNSPFGEEIDGKIGWTAKEWQEFIDIIHSIYEKHNAVPMLYGLDTTHGANYVQNATLFPQPLACASSFNTELAFSMGQIEAKDTIAAKIPWLFSPVLGLARQPKWSRVYETFGEDPYLVSNMGASVISGIQSWVNQSAACMKHFIGYSNPTSGNDRSDIVINDWELINYYARPFLKAVETGVKTVMETYASLNGEPVIASHRLLTSLLRHDMQFEGVLVSDDSEIYRLISEHHLVKTGIEALEITFSQSSLDMNMVPSKYASVRDLVKLVESNRISMERIDASVRRILKLKEELNLLTYPLRPSYNKTAEISYLQDTVGSAKDLKVALELARESIILLQNNNQTLPITLSKANSDLKNIFLTGPIADNKGYLCGGWSIFWQGTNDSSYIPHGVSIKEALERHQQTSSSDYKLNYQEGVDIDGNIDIKQLQTSLELVLQSDYTIVVLGESNYAEKKGDINELTLPLGQLKYLKYVVTHIKKHKANTKLVLILIEGRPRLLDDVIDEVDAILLSFLPCEQGGQAIVETLLGHVNPSGRLPITYPKNAGEIQMPYYHRVNTMCFDSFDECEMQWTFGTGLSYTSFTYSNITLNKHVVRHHQNETLIVSVTVTNTGLYNGKETILLFLSQLYRRASVPETKLLKKHHKVFLKVNESKNVVFELDSKDWGFYLPSIGNGFHEQVENGEYVVFFKYDTDCDVAGHLCRTFHII